jgi:energy-coupling factor transporter transmembrane protein EcfT
VALKERPVVFRYRKGNSIFHRIPAPVKCIALLCASASVMVLPASAVCAGIAAMIIPACIAGFTAREQLADIRPALMYMGFLYALTLTVNLFSAGIAAAPRPWTEIAVFHPAYLVYGGRLVLIMQLSALLFRTTTSIEIKATLCRAETGIRRLIKKAPFARNISLDARLGKSAALMMSFIPVLFELWEKLNRAYRARSGGRAGLGMQKAHVLLAALVSLAFHHAAEKARALAARESGAA